MRSRCLFFTISLAAGAQQYQQQTTYDGLGKALPTPSSEVSVNGNVTTRTQTMHSVNGRKVPLEQVEERILRDDSQGRVVERFIKRFDPNGNPLPPEKARIEEQRLPDGSSTINTTVYRGDLSGGLKLAERRLTEKRSLSSGSTVTETVERPSINGILETAERRSAVTRKTTDGEVTDTVVYSNRGGGELVESAREVVEKAKTPSGAQENVTSYESTSTGRMSLASQTIRRSVKTPDGSEQVVVDFYKRDAPGEASSADHPRPQLIEQRIIGRAKRGGEVLETLDVRRPNSRDASRLGPPERISESVCTGKCGEIK